MRLNFSGRVDFDVLRVGWRARCSEKDTGIEKLLQCEANNYQKVTNFAVNLGKSANN
jgi:hypothetical protein